MNQDLQIAPQETKLIFVRHGEAVGNVTKVFHGFTDSDLTENGKAQAERAALRLQNEPIDRIFSSDLKRARETAQAVAKSHGLKVMIDPRLREINGGLWENVPFDELPKKYPESFRLWNDHPYAVQMPEGESMAAFYTRITEAVRDITQRCEGETVCIVTHGTAIRLLSCFSQGKSPEEINDVTWCDNAAITVITHDADGFHLRVDGDNSHLADISTLEKQDWWRKK